MKKLIVFDLDETLSEQEKEVEPHVIEALKQMEESGLMVALCSGKSAFYLSGLLRQVGLKNKIIIGENGAEVSIGDGLPPKKFGFIAVKPETLKKLSWLKEQILTMFDYNIWFQHNRYAVSPFPTNEEGFAKIEAFLNKHKHKLEGLTIYRHPDCFDIVPEEVNKKAGLEMALKLLHINKSEMVAVGDGVNDYPMFDLADVSIGINLKDPSKATVNVTSIEEALHYIKNKLM
jgi:HAD superfamily hydrolase (TIGR01484 family)